jgi:glutathione S-transferase
LPGKGAQTLRKAAADSCFGAGGHLAGCDVRPKGDAMLTFYYAPHTCALATHIALIDAGADYAPIRVDFAKDQQNAPAFRGVNPKGRVPALVTEQGILTETVALLAYIAQTFPQAGLAPLGDPFAFAQMQAFNAYLAATLHVAHAHGPRGNRWSGDPAAIQAMKAHVPTSVGACFALVEEHLLQGPFVLGDTYSVADPYLFTVAQWIEGDGVDPARIPRVMQHRAMMAARPSVIRALAEEA